MAHFITRDALTKQQHEQYWPTFSTPHSHHSQTGKIVVEPARFVTKLRELYSVPDDPGLSERARGPDSTRWWPRWILDSPVLNSFLGRPVECTDDPDLFGAKYVWVGVPFSGSIPSRSHVGHAQTPFTQCMVSLVTHDEDPSDKRAYIWVTVNRDGDVVRLSDDVLEALLATEISELKSLAHRHLLMAATAAVVAKEGYVKAAQLIALHAENVPGFEAGTLLPFQDEFSGGKGTPPDANFMTPVKTAALPNRARVLASVDLSIERKVESGVEVLNPYLGPGTPTPEARETFKRVLQYVIHYGQYSPAFKELLKDAPNDDDYDKILKDPAFVQYLRVYGDLTTHQ